jgi:hypothetical protein
VRTRKFLALNGRHLLVVTILHFNIKRDQDQMELRGTQRPCSLIFPCSQAFNYLGRMQISGLFVANENIDCNQNPIAIPGMPLSLIRMRASEWTADGNQRSRVKQEAQTTSFLTWLDKRERNSQRSSASDRMQARARSVTQGQRKSTVPVLSISCFRYAF